MKKVFAMLLLLTFAMVIFAGCSTKTKHDEDMEQRIKNSQKPDPNRYKGKGALE